MRRALGPAALIALFALAGCRGGTSMLPVSGPPQPGAAVRAAHWWKNDIAPRYQWNHNYGYCGEVSEISAGLYYGEYLSQYDARAAADDAPQNRYRSQLLLGINALQAAEKMHLRAVAWKEGDPRDTEALLTWVKENVIAARPVVIGIYMNQWRFYHKRSRTAGSKQYDHIVPVIGIGSNHPRDDKGYFGDDTILFSDNGEWSSSRRSAQYFFQYRFDSFQRTRRQANAHRGPIYSISDDARVYGLAVLGVQDGDHETLPVRVETNLNYEHPQIAQGSSKRPAAEPLTLTVSVSGMIYGEKYNLYRYDRLSAIPDRAFNRYASKASEKWNISPDKDGRYVMTEKIASDEIAAYRVVPINAP